jgi:hydrogenase maturation factor
VKNQDLVILNGIQNINIKGALRKVNLMAKVSLNSKGKYMLVHGQMERN